MQISSIQNKFYKYFYKLLLNSNTNPRSSYSSTAKLMYYSLTLIRNTLQIQHNNYHQKSHQDVPKEVLLKHGRAV